MERKSSLFVLVLHEVGNRYKFFTFLIIVHKKIGLVSWNHELAKND